MVPFHDHLLNLMDLGNLTKLMILPETPNVVLTVMCLLVSAWAVRHGIKVVVRYSALFAFISYAILAVSVLLALSEANLQNFLPMFDQPVIKYIQGTHIITTIPFGETVVF